jgi:hypothetical protein
MAKLSSTAHRGPKLSAAGSFWLTILACGLAAPILFADSDPRPEPASSAQEPPAADAASQALVNTPSRLVGYDAKPYLKAVTANLAMRDRQLDPFGKIQDPEAKPSPTTPARPLVRAAPEPAVPLSEIVRLIKVTTVIPSERLFLVGTRSIKQGDKFPLNFRGKTTHVEVIEVASRRIAFRNGETGEIGILPLDLLPQGMTPAGKEPAPPPTMEPLNASEPLILGGN